MVDDALNSIPILSGVHPRITQRINDFRVVEELVQVGAGIALMPRYVRPARGLSAVLEDLRAIAAGISSTAAGHARGRSARPARD